MAHFLHLINTRRQLEQSFMEEVIQEALSKGVEMHLAGEFDLASQLFDSILKLQPEHADANHNMGLLKLDMGQDLDALPYLQIALQADMSIAQFWLSYIKALIKLEKLEDAGRILELAKETGFEGDEFFELSRVLGGSTEHQTVSETKLDTSVPPQETIDLLVTLYNQGQLAEVEKQAKALLQQYPDAFIVCNIIGLTAAQTGNFDQAIEAFQKAVFLNPTDADTHNNLGLALQYQNKLDEAIASYNTALSLKPDYTDAYYNKGVSLQDQGKLDEAIAAYNTVTELLPDHIDAHYNTGLALQEQGKLEEAIGAYDNTLSIKPDHAEAHNNRGNALKEQGKLEDAFEAYNKAISLKPDYAEAYNNLGLTLYDQGKFFEAIDTYKKALSFDPDYSETHIKLANVLKDLGRLDEAIEGYDKVLAVEPDNSRAHALAFDQLSHVCNWARIARNYPHYENLGIFGNSIPPFALLTLEDAPDRHRLRAENFVGEKFSQKTRSSLIQPSRKPERLRIGYFSADFCNHATMHLFAGILAAHDKTQFEIIAFSYGPNVQDETRRRMIENVDVFHDIYKMADLEIVELAKEARLDIAIDLKGFTKDNRLALFAHRLAPVQISYLGYPGTLGADFIDYIVADTIVIPEDSQQHYSEQIIYLPNSYQPNDEKRDISDKVFTREDVGLPEQGFVFCCFNNNYKISPKEFDIWMRLLNKVDGSVLWLFKSNKWAEENLKREAEIRGVDPSRLVFATKLPPAEHLARLRLADLFLDTFNVNAHTTASDALWAGLPLVTKLGKGFAARVGGSLLNAIGLSELITENEADYEALILDLATTPSKLSNYKKRLNDNRISKPLFDTRGYTKHLETGYQLAYQRYFDGKPPEKIIVPNTSE